MSKRKSAVMAGLVFFGLLAFIVLLGAGPSPQVSGAPGVTGSAVQNVYGGILSTSNVTIEGGLGTASVNGAVGNLTLQGSDNTNTGSSVAAGSLTARAGQLSAGATNRPGADAILGAGNGTGNGTPGHPILQCSSINASGTGAQTINTCYTIHKKLGSTTSATATNVVSISNAAANTGGIKFTVHVEAISASAACSVIGEYLIATQNTSGTVTTNVSNIGTNATICNSTNTLTIAVAASAASPSVVSVTPTFNFTPTLVGISSEIVNLGQQAITLQ